MISLYLTFIISVILASLDLYILAFLIGIIILFKEPTRAGLIFFALFLYFLSDPSLSQDKFRREFSRGQDPSREFTIIDIYEKVENSYFIFQGGGIKKYSFISNRPITEDIREIGLADGNNDYPYSYIGGRIWGEFKFIDFNKAGLVGEFDEEAFFAGKGLSGRLEISRSDNYKPGFSVKRVFLFLREEIEKRIDRLPKDGGIFLKRVILAKDIADRELKEDMKDLGLSHILAASGLHVNLIFSFILNILAYLEIDRRKIAFFIFIILFIYAKIINSPPSILRALYFCLFRELSLFCKEKKDARKVFLLSLCLVILPAPYRILDKGLQLSFACCLGMEIKKSLEGVHDNRESLIDQLKTGLWIFIMNLPIISSMSSGVSISSLFINILVIPVFSGLFSIGLLSLLLMDLPLIGAFSAFIYAFLYKFFTFLIEGMKILVTDEGSIFFNRGQLVLYYLLIGLIYLIKSGRLRTLRIKYYAENLEAIFFRDRFINTFKRVLIWAICLILLPGIFLKSLPSFTAIDVGQGDSFLLMAGGRRILFDTGGKMDFRTGQNIQAEKLYYQLLSMGVDRLDAIFISHKDYDHIGNLEELAKLIKIDSIFVSPARSKFDLIITDKDGKPVTINRVRSKEKYLIEAKNPLYNIFYNNPLIYVVEEGKWDAEDKNNGSMLLYIDMGLRIFMTGDREEDPPIYPDRFDILKIAHHGSAGGTSKEFLEKIKIKRAIISAGRNNRYKHPAKEVLERLDMAGIKYDRTDRSGSLAYYGFYNRDKRFKGRDCRILVVNEKKARLLLGLYLLMIFLILLVIEKIIDLKKLNLDSGVKI